MKVILHAEHDLELVDFGQPEFEVESAQDEVQFAAVQMFATSLALCAFSVLHGFGLTHHIDSDTLRIRVRWGYARDPLRIRRIIMSIRWPGLPEAQREAAEREAAHCTLHHTLQDPPELTTRVVQ